MRNSKDYSSIILATLLALFVGLAIGSYISFGHGFLTTIVRAVITLFTTFIGAWLAFKFQNKREDDKKYIQNIEAGNRAIFTLARIVNELDAIQKQAIDPYREHPDIFLIMPPFLTTSYDDIKFDVESLTSVLQSPAANVLGELLVEESRFRQAVLALSNRSELHRYEVQPALEAAGLAIGDRYHMQDFKNALGERLFIQLKMSTENLIEHVDKTLLSSTALIKRLPSEMKKIYPGGVFIELDSTRKDKAPA